MRYKVSVTELLPVRSPVEGEGMMQGLEVEGQALFTTTVEFKPNIAKLVAALTPPRIRKSRAKSA